MKYAVCILVLALLMGCEEQVDSYVMSKCKEVCAPSGISEVTYARCACKPKETTP